MSIVSLPRYYLITPAEVTCSTQLLSGVHLALTRGVRLLQLRCPYLTEQVYVSLARDVLDLANSYGALLILNQARRHLADLPGVGLHLNGQQLSSYSKRPLPRSQLLSVACHHADDLAKARALDADLMTLSPIYATPSSPSRTALGWSQFASLVKEAHAPCYALGGLMPTDFALALQHGAYGIAAIRSLWSREGRQVKL